MTPVVSLLLDLWGTVVFNPAWEELGLILRTVQTKLLVGLYCSGAGMSVNC